MPGALEPLGRAEQRYGALEKPMARRTAQRVRRSSCYVVPATFEYDV